MQPQERQSWAAIIMLLCEGKVKKTWAYIDATKCTDSAALYSDSRVVKDMAAAIRLAGIHSDRRRGSHAPCRVLKPLTHHPADDLQILPASRGF